MAHPMAQRNSVNIVCVFPSQLLSLRFRFRPACPAERDATAAEDRTLRSAPLSLKRSGDRPNLKGLLTRTRNHQVQNALISQASNRRWVMSGPHGSSPGPWHPHVFISPHPCHAACRLLEYKVSVQYRKQFTNVLKNMGTAQGGLWSLFQDGSSEVAVAGSDFYHHVQPGTFKSHHQSPLEVKGKCLIGGKIGLWQMIIESHLGQTWGEKDMMGSECGKETRL